MISAADPLCTGNLRHCLLGLVSGLIQNWGMVMESLMSRKQARKEAI
jgi:hypothetical protein